MNRALALLAPAAILIAAPAHAESRAEAFQKTLAAHFAAVNARDLAALEKTLTQGESLALFLPNGKRTTTRAEFVAFHVEWFKETTWSMQFDLLSSIVTDDLAVATVRTHYADTVEGKPYWSESWLTLVFKWEGAGGWRLVHDQNTRIRTSADPAA